MNDGKTKPLMISSKDFADNGKMPSRLTGFGEDVSPEFTLLNLDGKTETLVIVMNDLDIPVMPEYNHWLIWNIPAMSVIPGCIPAGEKVPGLGGAIQGIGFGKHRYRGPKQPVFVRGAHRYIFHIFALDCKLSIPSTSKKEAVMEAIQGHILQEGSITGVYKRADKKK